MAMQNLWLIDREHCRVLHWPPPVLSMLVDDVAVAVAVVAVYVAAVDVVVAECERRLVVPNTQSVAVAGHVVERGTTEQLAIRTFLHALEDLAGTTVVPDILDGLVANEPSTHLRRRGIVVAVVAALERGIAGVVAAVLVRTQIEVAAVGVDVELELDDVGVLVGDVELAVHEK